MICRVVQIEESAVQRPRGRPLGLPPFWSFQRHNQKLLPICATCLRVILRHLNLRHLLWASLLLTEYCRPRQLSASGSFFATFTGRPGFYREHVQR